MWNLTSENFLKLYLPVLIIIAGSILIAFAVRFYVYNSLEKRFSAKPDKFFYTFFKRMRGPLTLIFPLIFIGIATSILDFNRAADIINLIAKSLIIVTVSWSLIQLIDYSDVWVIDKHPENFNRVAAKFYLLKKVIKIVIIIFAVAFFLMNFDSVKEIGRGLLLSASVVGGIVLFAAQGILGNLISGFQLTFTRPLNIGDNVIVNNEFCTVEEVSLTRVIVKIWDSRRLVVPSSYFITNPYENWTYPTSDLLGTIFLYTDYSVNLEALRGELQRILPLTPLWDQRLAKIEVSDMTERNMQLRILVSVRNADDSWLLRCYVRERLIDFLSKNFPESLPKMHATLDEIDLKKAPLNKDIR